jgi:hypothetical protein
MHNTLVSTWQLATMRSHLQAHPLKRLPVRGLRQHEEAGAAAAVSHRCHAVLSVDDMLLADTQHIPAWHLYGAAAAAAVCCPPRR